MVASVTNWICGQVGVAKVTTKDGIDIPVEVNYDSEEYKEETLGTDHLGHHP